MHFAQLALPIVFTGRQIFNLYDRAVFSRNELTARNYFLSKIVPAISVLSFVFTFSCKVRRASALQEEKPLTPGESATLAILGSGYVSAHFDPQNHYVVNTQYEQVHFLTQQKNNALDRFTQVYFQKAHIVCGGVDYSRKCEVQVTFKELVDDNFSDKVITKTLFMGNRLLVVGAFGVKLYEVSPSWVKGARENLAYKLLASTDSSGSLKGSYLDAVQSAYDLNAWYVKNSSGQLLKLAYDSQKNAFVAVRFRSRDSTGKVEANMVLSEKFVSANSADSENVVVADPVTGLWLMPICYTFRDIMAQSPRGHGCFEVIMMPDQGNVRHVFVRFGDISALPSHMQSTDAAGWNNLPYDRGRTGGMLDSKSIMPRNVVEPNRIIPRFTTDISGLPKDIKCGEMSFCHVLYRDRGVYYFRSYLLKLPLESGDTPSQDKVNFEDTVEADKSYEYSMPAKDKEFHFKPSIEMHGLQFIDAYQEFPDRNSNGLIPELVAPYFYEFSGKYRSFVMVYGNDGIRIIESAYKPDAKERVDKFTSKDLWRWTVDQPIFSGEDRVHGFSVLSARFLRNDGHRADNFIIGLSASGDLFSLSLDPGKVPRKVFVKNFQP